MCLQPPSLVEPRPQGSPYIHAQGWWYAVASWLFRVQRRTEISRTQRSELENRTESSAVVLRSILYSYVRSHNCINFPTLLSHHQLNALVTEGAACSAVLQRRPKKGILVNRIRRIGGAGAFSLY